MDAPARFGVKIEPDLPRQLQHLTHAIIHGGSLDMVPLFARARLGELDRWREMLTISWTGRWT